jgi:hypothetical protein
MCWQRVNGKLGVASRWTDPSEKAPEAQTKPAQVEQEAQSSDPVAPEVHEALFAQFA